MLTDTPAKDLHFGSHSHGMAHQGNLLRYVSSPLVTMAPEQKNIESVLIQVDRPSLDEGVRGHADMDDTLVMTGDADLKAYTDVVKLAKQLHGKVEFLCAMPLAREHPLKIHYREAYEHDIH